MTRNARVLMNRITTGKKDSQEFFETPNWVTKILLDHQSFNGPIWEFACGAGKISKYISKTIGNKVISTDKYKRGFGKSGIDFLTTTKLLAPNMITNPPFNLINKFIKQANILKPTKLALLYRTLGLESQGRYKLFKMYKPSKVITIVDRVMFGSEEPGGFWSLSWFIWDKYYQGETILELASFYD